MHDWHLDPPVVISLISVFFSTGLALAVILRGRRSPANWLFLTGMLALAGTGLFDVLSRQSSDLDAVMYWQGIALISKSFLPGIWLCFSLTFSRGNYGEFLSRWRLPIALSFIVPLVLVAGFQAELVTSLKVTENQEPVWLDFGFSGKALNLLLLIASVLILMNLEKTFRAAVGTMRWRIKYIVLGLAVIFGAKIYTGSQAMLYSGVSLSFSLVEATAVIIGSGLITVGHLRAGKAEIDVYPSQAFLYSSVTVIIVGVYLSVIGLLARIVTMIGGDTAFPVKSFLVLLSVVGLAIVLLSDRFQQQTRRFVSRHFHRPLYDYRMVWKSFTKETISRVDQVDLCRTVTTFISELLQVLSVNIWLVDAEKGTLVFGASTSLASSEGTSLTPSNAEAAELIKVFQNQPEPVDFDASSAGWAATLRRCTPGEFRHGGHRLCAPMMAGGELRGLITLGDRVGGVAISVQDTDLLKCIADQAAAGLQNIQLSQKLMRNKEMEAFQTMSAFFVHDLKNTASTLSLMLKNLPVHFNDPAFREDALRGISNTVNHINSLIGRLSLLRQGLAIHPVQCDLNKLITQAIKDLNGTAELPIHFQPGIVSPIALDSEQIQKVVLNLVLNAKESLNQEGSVQISTLQENGSTIITVTDNGCGMSPEFVKSSLFRPFQTTKQRGIGIGMFQSKMIVEAHRGRIEVQSVLGKGTTFRVILPSRSDANES